MWEARLEATSVPNLLCLIQTLHSFSVVGKGFSITDHGVFGDDLESRSSLVPSRRGVCFEFQDSTQNKFNNLYNLIIAVSKLAGLSTD